MLNVTLWAFESGQILAAGSSDDDSGGLGLVFLLSGFVFYSAIYFRYRNTDKRHGHESETEATMLNMQEHDEFVKARKGLSNRRMSGSNNTAVRGASNKFSAGIMSKFKL